jgi:hypothetical protein
MYLKTVLAGVLAAVAMFIWSWLAHAVLPLGMIGMSTLQNERAVVDALKSNIDRDGLYIFPLAMMKGQTDVEGPEGIIVYQQNITEISPATLGSEFLLEVVEMVILAFLVFWSAMTSFAGRLGFSALAGLMVAITTNGSYHIWFGFPIDYTLAQIAIVILGFTLGGSVIALMLPKNMKAMG